MQKSDAFFFQTPTGKFEPVVVESAILYRKFQNPTEQILHANHTAAIGEVPTFQIPTDFIKR